MKKKKRIDEIMIIGFLLIILILVIVLIIQKNHNLENNRQPIENNNNNNNNNSSDNNDKEAIKADYTGIVTCIMPFAQDEEYQIYNLDEIEVSEGIVQSRSFFTRIKYVDKDNYEGFKMYEKVNNPTYDDKNLTITYIRDEKIDLTEYQRNIQEFSEELEQNGYTCKAKS